MNTFQKNNVFEGTIFVAYTKKFSIYNFTLNPCGQLFLVFFSFKSILIIALRITLKRELIKTWLIN